MAATAKLSELQDFPAEAYFFRSTQLSPALLAAIAGACWSTIHIPQQLRVPPFTNFFRLN